MDNIDKCTIIKFVIRCADMHICDEVCDIRNF